MEILDKYRKIRNLKKNIGISKAFDDAKLLESTVIRKTLYLNGLNFTLLKLYKSHCHMFFSVTFNELMRRNLGVPEKFILAKEIKWLDNFRFFLTYTNPTLKEYTDALLQCPVMKVKHGQYKDVTMYIDKDIIYRMNELRSSCVFDNWSYDKIFTYIISLDELNEITDETVRKTVKDSYSCYSEELVEFKRILDNNLIEVIKKVVVNVLERGLFKLHILLFLNCLNLSLELIIDKIRNKEIIKINECKELIIKITELLTEQDYDFKRANGVELVNLIENNVRILKEIC